MLISIALPMRPLWRVLANHHPFIGSSASENTKSKPRRMLKTPVRKLGFKGFFFYDLGMDFSLISTPLVLIPHITLVNKDVH